MPEPVEGSRPYSAGLDGIRAVAVLGVIAYHLGWSSGGLLGVGVFFVLSGYLITDLLVAEYRRTGGMDLLQFWLRRAKRLLPALFSMLFVVVGWATLFDRTQLPELRDDIPSAVAYFSNWWFIYQHVSYFARFGPPSPLGHLWSLAIEEQFYLCWPLLLLAGLALIRSSKARVALVSVIAVGSALEMALLYTPPGDPTRVYDGTDTRAFALLIGAALALAWPRDSKTWPITPGARRVLELAGGMALAGIVVLFLVTSEYETFLYRGGMLILALLSAVLIVVTAHPGARLGEWLGIAPLRWIGKRSYGIYLWSYPVIVFTTPENKNPGTLRSALDVGATLLLAAVSWRYLEEPIRHGALGRLWSHVRSRQRSLLHLDRRGWAVASLAVANGALCIVGLSGLVVARPLEPSSSVSAILPAGRADAGGARSASTSTSSTLPISTVGITGPPTGHAPRGAGVTAIGDSIMIDAAPYLLRLLPGVVIDAVEGQQLYGVLNDVPELRAEGAIGDRLIVELGTNGSFTPAQLVALLRALGPMKKIVIVNTCVPRPWKQEVNEAIATVARSYPEITVVNWAAIGPEHPGYFYPDGVHLDPNGARFFAGLINAALGPPSLTSSNATSFAPGFVHRGT